MAEFQAFIDFILGFFALLGIVTISIAVYLGIKGLRIFAERLIFYRDERICKDKTTILENEQLIIEQIQESIPDFSGIYFKELAFNQLITLHHAFEERNINFIKNDECDALLNMHRIQIEEWIQNKEIPIYEQHHLIRVDLEEYKKEANKEILSVILNVNLIHYLWDEENEEVLEGKKTLQNQNYRMEFIKTNGISAFGENIGMATKCPQCGSRVSIEISDICNHCGSSIKNNNYSWLLNEISQF